MPLKNLPCVSIQCDKCNREYSIVWVAVLSRELAEAESHGWECDRAPEGGPVVCPQCREEAEGD